MNDHRNLVDINKAKKLLEINKMLTQSLKIDEVLRNVIVAANDLIDISDTLIIYLYDESANRLRLADGEGIRREMLENIAFSPGESIAGKVFVDKKSKLFISEEEIDSYMRDMSEANYHYYFEGVYRRKIKSAFCVPILTKDRCLGVLVVNNFKQDGVFTKEDIQVIEIVADQSAIAIDNSSMYHSLKEKNNLLTQSMDIHNQFYKMIIEGGGVERVIRLLESIIHSKVTHHSTAFYEDKDTLFPIVRGKEVLGILELEKSFYLFSPMDQIAIKHASLTLALELVKNNAIHEKELHFRSEVFNQLLEGLSNDDLDRALTYIQWKEDWILQCIIIEGENGPLWEQEKLTDKEWFIRSIEQIVTSIGIYSVVFTRAFQVIIIVPTIQENVVHKIIKSINAKWGAKKQLLFGIGRETTIRNLSLTYKEALRSVAFAKSNKDSTVVEYAKLGIERLLHEVDPATIEMFMHDKLSELFKMGSSFMDTLKCFIEQNKNHKKTAEVLHVHPNTLYYRLKKLEEVLQIDINNEKQWLDLVIAMKLFMASNKKDV
ncbi:helix-turn-helix domain-containing protein [Virgibacillus sp. C22-A2]|uniref:Helix-turn-helix domain-containing protein n=1 Tax=Virgibacillus tibetensis TaxID=3042313 RepID=A0ABU6KGA0_9BACI|nr:helix-turn-helix domain-containing protein [Virgibacillus sp. C22-A2]